MNRLQHLASSCADRRYGTATSHSVSSTYDNALQWSLKQSQTSLVSQQKILRSTECGECTSTTLAVAAKNAFANEDFSALNNQPDSAITRTRRPEDRTDASQHLLGSQPVLLWPQLAGDWLQLAAASSWLMANLLVLRCIK